jgi:hypothetical protein
MEDFKQVLLDRLVKQEPIRRALAVSSSLAKILSQDPDVDPAAANERLRYLGWQEVHVDYHILQLALACFELQTGAGASPLGESERSRQVMRLRDVEIAPISLNDL